VSHHDVLIFEIERDAIDHTVPVATALRRCVVLGGRSGSEALRDWATRELEGYLDQDEVPKYRAILAPLMVDGRTSTETFEHRQIAASSLPDVAHGRVTEELTLRQGAGELEGYLELSDIRLQPPLASELVRLMNHESGNPNLRLISLYWSVSPVAINGVLDQIRTTLTKLIAELRATMPQGQDVPTGEQADRAGDGRWRVGGGRASDR
jgi:hypothetical protein